MKSKPAFPLGNQRGAALIITALILMVVTVIGIMSIRTANIEMQVATHDKVHKMTWFATDAVVDGLMPELIEQNIAQRGFGNQTPPISYGNSNSVGVYNSEFFMNETCAVPSEATRDVQVDNVSQADVYVSVYGDAALLPGNAIQLPEGYEGRGKGLAGGGSQILFVIRGLGLGAANSQARVSSAWRHVN